LYDPVAGGWTTTGSLNTARKEQTATLLSDGRALVAGGSGVGGSLTSAEVYDTNTGFWTSTGSLSAARYHHTATLLPDGRVLIAGGYAGGSDYLASAEVFDSGLGFADAWRPQTTATNPPFDALSGRARLEFSGTQLQGLSEASGGGTGSSATNYPLVQLRRIDNEQTQWVRSTEWSDTSVTTLALNGFPHGPATVTLFVNGIPSVSHVVPVLENLPPVAVTDSYSTTQNGTLIVSASEMQGSVMRASADSTWVTEVFGEAAARVFAEAAAMAPPVQTGPGVLANDIEYEDDPLIAWRTTDPVSGTVALDSDGGFIYVPDVGAWGTDHFDYIASDGIFTSTARVTINIIPTHPPEPLGDSYETLEDEVLEVVGMSVLDNDSDPDGDPLTVSRGSDPISGTMALESDGQFIYVPDAGAWGVDRFDYVASDGIYTATAQVTITITPVASAPLAEGSPGTEDHLDLTWTPDSSNCRYNVWQNTGPYQLPGSGLLLDTLPAGSDSYSISGVIGDPLTNYYFVVEAIGCADDRATSNEVGEFDFSLEPGG
jgi:hypothetical protein